MSLELQVFIPWLITVLAETAVFLVWGLRRLKEIGVGILVNTVTNPVLSVLVILMNLYLPVFWQRVCISVLEVIIFFVEARLFAVFLERCRHPYLLSLSANAASFVAGLLAFPLFIH